MLAMVRKTDSFDLAGDDGKRTLSATANIPAGTVLMEIPRDLMM
jgi:homoserine acetyltransferase